MTLPRHNHSDYSQFWIHMGQVEAKALPAGMYGIAIWTEDGDVLGFFGYVPAEGVMQTGIRFSKPVLSRVEHCRIN